MSMIRRRASCTTPELESKLIAHRNKILGVWAAERMGMMGEVAVEYALGLVGTAAKDAADTALVKKAREGVTPFDGLDAGPVPAPLVAVTVKV